MLTTSLSIYLNMSIRSVLLYRFNTYFSNTDMQSTASNLLSTQRIQTLFSHPLSPMSLLTSITSLPSLFQSPRASPMSEHQPLQKHPLNPISPPLQIPYHHHHSLIQNPLPQPQTARHDLNASDQSVKTASLSSIPSLTILFWSQSRAPL